MREPSDPMLPSFYRVQRVWRETHDTYTLALQPPDGASQREFAPGQFNMLYHFGVGEVPISISGNPAETRSLLHTIRAVGTVTNAIKRLRRGASIGVRGPFGSSWPTTQAKGGDCLLVAGGLGLAPLRPAWYQLLTNRADYGRVVLLYGARTPRDLLYRQWLDELAKRAGVEVDVTVDAANQQWGGNVGLVTALISRAQFDPANTTAMICGPDLMMRHVTSALLKSGVSATGIYLSIERNMKCAVGFCGHCQFGPTFVCKDGPVFRYDRIKHFLGIRNV